MSSEPDDDAPTVPVPVPDARDGTEEYEECGDTASITSGSGGSLSSGSASYSTAAKSEPAAAGKKGEAKADEGAATAAGGGTAGAKGGSGKDGGDGASTAADAATASNPDYPERCRGLRLGLRHVKAILIKNAIQKYRTPALTFFELFTPVAMMLILVAAYTMTDTTYAASRTYDTIELGVPGPWVEIVRRGLDYVNVGGVGDDLGGIVGGAVGGGGRRREERKLGSSAAPLDLAANLDDMMRKVLPTWMGLDMSDDGDDAMEFHHHYPSNEFDVQELDPNEEEVDRELGGDDRRAGTRKMQGSVFDLFNDARRELDNVLQSPLPIPTFGQYVALSSALTSLIPPSDYLNLLHDSSFGREWGNLLTLGTLHVSSPDVDTSRDLVRYLNETHGGGVLGGMGGMDRLKVRVHDTEEEAVRFINDNLDERTWALVDLSTGDVDGSALENTNDFKFKIRMNYTTIPNTNQITDYVAIGLNRQYQRYYLSGYLTLQRTLNEFAFHRLNNGKENQDGEETDSACTPPGSNGMLDAGVWSMPMPTAAYSQNSFFTAVGYLLGLTIAMAYMYPVSRLIKSIVEEKETRMKETMLILGMRPWAHRMGWTITSVLVFLIIDVFVVLTLSSNVLMHSDPAYLFLFVFLFSTATVSFSFFVAAFFSRAKLAAIVGPVALFATLLPRWIFFGTNRYEATAGKYWASLLPCTAFAFGADIVADYEYSEQGVQSYNAGEGDYSFDTALGFLFLDTLIYFVLAWYVELVIPRQYGVAKRWYFVFQPSYWCAGFSPLWRLKRGKEDDSSSIGMSSAGETESFGTMGDNSSVAHNFEPVSDPSLQPQVQISHLVKQYTQKPDVKPAVDNLNLTMYESQITCLLGHNGAGKTSAISVLTGLFPPTSGDCRVYGKSISEELQEARQSMGICPQHNVLFDRLTVLEHLMFFERIKGLRPSRSRIVKRAKEIGLGDFLGTRSSVLSGGNKRKLSVAIAFCGDPQFLLLDEPTSGMDPYSRRATWELLRRKKDSRVILLTTHFMDEADLLADRIAVMKEGQLQCCGSPLFLKNRFGLGYNLTVVLAGACSRAAGNADEDELEAGAARNVVELNDPAEDDRVTSEITSFLASCIPGTELVRKSAKELMYRFPQGSEDLFPSMFESLAVEQQRLGIGAYGISNTTLEEVFLQLEGADDQNPAPTASRIVASSIATGTISRHGQPHDAAGKVFGGAPDERVSTKDARTTSRKLPAVEHDRTYMKPRDQVALLLRKRFLIQKRDLKGAFFMIVLPVIIIGLVLLILMLDVVFSGQPIELSMDLYDTSPSGSTAETDVLVGGGAAMRQRLVEQLDSSRKGDIAEMFQGMKTLLGDEYPHAGFSHLEEASSSEQMSSHLLDTYNDHKHHARYGAFVLEDSIKVSLDIDMEQMKTYAGSMISMSVPDIGAFLGVNEEDKVFHAAIHVKDIAAYLFDATSLSLDSGLNITFLKELTGDSVDMLTGLAIEMNNTEWVEPFKRTARVFVSDLADSLRKDDLNNREIMDIVADFFFSSVEVITGEAYTDVNSALKALFSRDNTLSRSQVEKLVTMIVERVMVAMPDTFLSTDLNATKIADTIADSFFRFMENLTGEPYSDMVTAMTDLLGDNALSRKDVEMWLVKVIDSITNEVPLVVDTALDSTRIANAIAEAAFEMVEELTGEPYTDMRSALKALFGKYTFERADIEQRLNDFVERVVELRDDVNVTTVVDFVMRGFDYIASIAKNYDVVLASAIVSDAIVEKVMEDFTTDGYSNVRLGDIFGLLSEIGGGDFKELNGYWHVKVSIGSPGPASESVTAALSIENKKGTILTEKANFNLDDVVEVTKLLIPSNRLGLDMSFDTSTSIMHNSSSPHAIAAFNQAYMEYKYKECASQPRVKLTSVNHPLPLTTQQSLEIRSMLSVLASLFILIPYCYIPAAFIVFLVKERVSKSKHLQLVSGVNMSSYWISTYLWDLFLFLILTLLIMAVFAMYGAQSAKAFIGTTESFFCTMALTFGYGMSALPFAYLMSRKFGNHSTAQISIMGIFFITGFVAVNAYFIMMSLENTKHIAEALLPLFRMWPAYNVGDGLIQLSTSFLMRDILGEDMHPFDWDVCGKPLALLYGLSAPYFVLLLMLEYSHDGGSGGAIGRVLRWVRGTLDLAMLRWHGIQRSPDGALLLLDDGLENQSKENCLEDADVGAERTYVENHREQLKDSASVLMVDLWKVYPPSTGALRSVMRFLKKLFCSCCRLCFRRRASPDTEANDQSSLPKRAVRGLTTAVKEGETYGLLGVNGAGKTTTLGVLTGDCSPTSGDAYVAGFDVTGGTPGGVCQARKHIGFCPQVDPLLDLMTGRETLLMFGRLRGMRGAMLHESVDKLLDALTLSPHADKVSESYSGGNKRKLSLGVALIGNPKVLFIDEASSGMDPAARRKMWDLIAEASKHRSVVLTTHVMEEAEALCTRVGIMVSGELKCLGSVQHLKTTFLDGYTIDLNCMREAPSDVVDNVEQAILDILPGSHLAERHGRHLRIDILNMHGVEDDAPGLGGTFKRLQTLKQDTQYMIEDYSIAQCSLEEVFISLAKSSSENNSHQERFQNEST